MLKKNSWILLISSGMMITLLLVSGWAGSARAGANGGGETFIPMVVRPVGEYWIRYYGSVDEEVATAAFPNQEGGMYLLINQGSSSPNGNFVVVKLTSDGEILWQKGFGIFDFPDDFLNGRATSDGGLIISGFSYVGTYGAMVMKLDSAGNVQWTRHFGGQNLDYFSSVLETADDGYLFTGYTASFGNGISDLWLVKLNNSGNILWQKTIALNIVQHANSIKPTSDGGYILAGQSSDGTYIYDLWVLKIDNSGNIQWQKTYGGSEQEYGFDILEVDSGGYLVVGATTTFGAGDEDAWLLRLSATGAVLWQKSIGGTLDDRANAITATQDGNYVIAGSTQSFGAWGSYDTWLLKINAAGTILWEKNYGDIRNDTGLSIRELSNGTLLIAGQTQSYGAGGRDGFLLKLNPNGEVDGNCDAVHSNPATVTPTNVTPNTLTPNVANSQANAVNISLPAVTPNIEMGLVCSS